MSDNTNASIINGEIKSKIDHILDTLWAGGISVPITILEQLNYLFFIKLLDEKQRQQEARAIRWNTKVEKPIFLDGTWHNVETNQDVPYENLRWNNFIQLDAQRMFENMRNNVFEFIKNIDAEHQTAYSRYMKTAVFQIPTAAVLQSIVADIDKIPLSDTDVMGDMYEYMLKKMSESGQNGQFRTPRHIIKMMVELSCPTENEIMCDPAMGTAGFVLQTAIYIKEKYSKLLYGDPTWRNKFYSSMFTGYDTDQTMVRIGAMNMLLHGIPRSNIQQMDSLSSANDDTNKYTLILANPPFKGKLIESTINKSLLQTVRTTTTELLFLSLFVRSLQKGGRCFSIVPDGVLFQTNKAYLTIRKELVDNQCLRGVISMPSGVFKPYAGVSTAILIFTKTDAGGTDKVWFYEMHNDGYTLNDNRTPIEENDIPDIIYRWQHLDKETDRTRKEQSFFVPADEIRENNYDLTFNRYKEVVREKVEYRQPQEIFSSLQTLEDDFAKSFDELKSLI